MLYENASTIPAPPFAASVLFDDVDAEILAREDADTSGAWQSYMRKMLPVATQATIRPS